MLSLSCLEPQWSPGSNNALGGEGGGERDRETQRERVKRRGLYQLPAAYSQTSTLPPCATRPAGQRVLE